MTTRSTLPGSASSSLRLVTFLVSLGWGHRVGHLYLLMSILSRVQNLSLCLYPSLSGWLFHMPRPLYFPLCLVSGLTTEGSVFFLLGDDPVLVCLFACLFVCLESPPAQSTPGVQGSYLEGPGRPVGMLGIEPDGVTSKPVLALLYCRIVLSTSVECDLPDPDSGQHYLKCSSQQPQTHLSLFSLCFLRWPASSPSPCLCCSRFG